MLGIIIVVWHRIREKDVKISDLINAIDFGQAWHLFFLLSLLKCRQVTRPFDTPISPSLSFTQQRFVRIFPSGEIFRNLSNDAILIVANPLPTCLLCLTPTCKTLSWQLTNLSLSWMCFFISQFFHSRVEINRVCKIIGSLGLKIFRFFKPDRATTKDWC